MLYLNDVTRTLTSGLVIYKTSQISNFTPLFPHIFSTRISRKENGNVCTQVVELLKFIFTETPNRQKIVEELLVHDLFRNIDLREMRSASVTVRTYF